MLLHIRKFHSNIKLIHYDWLFSYSVTFPDIGDAYIWIFALSRTH